MLKKLERLAPHAAILICNMYVVFFLIDKVNPAMNFIDNGLTKGLLLLLCLIALYNAWQLLGLALWRGTARRSGSAARPAAARTRNGAPGAYLRDNLRDNRNAGARTKERARR